MTSESHLVNLVAIEEQRFVGSAIESGRSEEMEKGEERLAHSKMTGFEVPAFLKAATSLPGIAPT